jgi:hypothetical protein
MKWEFYSREKYKCPECGEYRFVRMINENGEFYPENVGRCDREDSCGYIYHATKWLQNNPDAKQIFNSGKVEQPKKKIIDGYYSFSEELWEVVKGNALRSSQRYKSQFHYTSEFKHYLINDLLFTNEFIDKMMNEYRMIDSQQMDVTYINGVEVSQGKSSIKYFYVSFSKEIRAVEQIFYEGFKRSKKLDNKILNMDFNRFGVNRKIYNIETTEINWCLFGEHLICEYPLKPIIIVEGVKTAFGMALYYPEYNWLATGSSNRLIHLNFKTDHEVHFLPDAGLRSDKSYAQVWKDKIKRMYGVSFKYDVYEFNDDCSTDEIKEGFDILDIQIKDPERAKNIINSIFKE